MGQARAWVEALLQDPEDTDDCILWPFARSAGYGVVRFQGQKRLVHVLVCEHFHGPRPPSMEACHSHTGDPHCVNPRHLRWDSHATNMADLTTHGTQPRGERHGMARLTEVDVGQIRQRYASGGFTQQALAQEFGVSRPHISDIVRGRKW